MADAKVTSKGQVTIPKEVRDRLSLVTGDSIKFEIEPDGRVTMRKRLSVRQLAGFLKRPGQKTVSIEEMDEAIGAAISDHVMKSLER